MEKDANFVHWLWQSGFAPTSDLWESAEIWDDIGGWFERVLGQTSYKYVVVIWSEQLYRMWTSESANAYILTEDALTCFEIKYMQKLAIGPSEDTAKLCVVDLSGGDDESRALPLPPTLAGEHVYRFPEEEEALLWLLSGKEPLSCLANGQWDTDSSHLREEYCQPQLHTRGSCEFACPSPPYHESSL